MTALLGVGVVVAALLFYKRRVTLPDPLTPSAVRSDELASRLDPNSADAVALSAIPQLGEKRARDIVQYREKFAITHPHQRAFDSAEDLMRISGIGMATVNNMRPYLRIAPPPATMP